MEPLILNKINTYLQKSVFNFDLLLSLRGVMAISVVFYHMFMPLDKIKSDIYKYFLFALDFLDT
jgi:hypothetical protein